MQLRPLLNSKGLFSLDTMGKKVSEFICINLQAYLSEKVL